MYFFNTYNAIKDLQADLIDDKETIKYLFGLGVISGLGVPVFLGLDEESVGGLLDFVVFIISLIALFVILRKCYTLNSQADDRNFLNRFLVLNFIISLRLLIIGIGLFIALLACMLIMNAVLTNLLPHEDRIFTSIHSMMIVEMFFWPLLEIILLVIWYYLLKKAFVQLTERISSQQ